MSEGKTSEAETGIKEITLPGWFTWYSETLGGEKTSWKYYKKSQH